MGNAMFRPLQIPMYRWNNTEEASTVLFFCYEDVTYGLSVLGKLKGKAPQAIPTHRRSLKKRHNGRY